MSGAPKAPQTRATPVPAVYYALLAEIERHRLKFGIPMWMMDDGAGANRGHYSHGLYPETPSGRMLTWPIVQMYLDTLFRQGFSIKIEAANASCLPASSHRVAIKFSDARYDFEARQDWMQQISKRGASKGGKARAAKLSKRRLSQIGKQGAKKRWSTPKIEEITQ
jgi:hypothetical protein